MPKRKASFYGVLVGNQPGVYDDWEVCKIQVLGFPGSKFKGFSTRVEAENYVNGFSTGHQTTAVPMMGIAQSQANANLDDICTQHPCPIAIEVRTQKDITSPLQPLTRVTTSKEEVIKPSFPLTRVSMRKEGVTSPAQPSTKDPSNYFKVVEENGQRFVIFESIKKFDSYFEGLCGTRHLPQASNQKAFCGIQEIKSQEQRSDSSQDLQTKGIYQLEFDGASKGNPGHGGAGALIRCPHGAVVLEVTEFLANATNNVAEYRALILGLKVALSKGIRRVRAQGDSKLVCLQVVGAWRVKNKNLISLHEEVKKLETLFEEFSISHVRREYNSAADALANEAVYTREPAREVAKPIPGCCL